MRENRRPSDTASACASVVLPTPGTSSISRWPPASRQATQSSICGAFADDDRANLVDEPRELRALTAGIHARHHNRKHRSEPPMATAFYSHPDCRLHDMGAGHPECPQRLDAIHDHLLATGLDIALDCRDAPLATLEQTRARAHASRYVAELQDLLRAGARRAASTRASTPTPSSAPAPGAPRCARPAPRWRPPTRCSTARSRTPSARCARPATTPRATRRWASASSTTWPSRRAMRWTCAACSAWRSSTSTCTTATAPKTSSPATSAC